MPPIHTALGLLLLGVLSFSSATSANKHVVFCYFQSWAVYRPGNGSFDVEDIDPGLCTHLLYAFAGIEDSNHTITSLDPWTDLDVDGGRGAYVRFTKLKKQNPELKTLLAVGGWNDGSDKYSTMAASAETRKAFVDSVVPFLEKFNFDGISLDWEYPGSRGGSPDDKANYGLLIKELKESFTPKGYILTAGLSHETEIISQGYDIPTLQTYLDFLNILAYDFGGPWDDYTEATAPMYASQEDIRRGRGKLNVNFTIHYYLSHGAEPSKLVLGVPFDGRGFTLQNASDHGLYAPISGPMPPCPYTQAPGTCSYGELCALYLNQPGWTDVRDTEIQAIYSYSDQYWVSYDDIGSIKIKSQYIRQLGLAGAVVWTVDGDDFRGDCQLGSRYPLLTELYRQMNGGLTSTTPAPSTANPPPATTFSPGDVCKQPGVNPNPYATCSPIFFKCTQTGGHWDAAQFSCSDGTVFDRLALVCVRPQDSPECN